MCLLVCYCATKQRNRKRFLKVQQNQANSEVSPVMIQETGIELLKNVSYLHVHTKKKRRAPAMASTNPFAGSSPMEDVVSSPTSAEAGIKLHQNVSYEPNHPQQRRNTPAGGGQVCMTELSGRKPKAQANPSPAQYENVLTPQHPCK